MGFADGGAFGAARAARAPPWHVALTPSAADRTDRSTHMSTTFFYFRRPA
jgi:hypothetical protein